MAEKRKKSQQTNLEENSRKDRLNVDNFPLMEKAKKEGVFNLQNGFLIAAPTATGKSKIGRDIIKASLTQKEPDTVLVYLVPFKALAEEVHQQLQFELPDAAIAIATSDYNRPYKLTEIDILVATYERAIGIFKADVAAWPSVVIADEASIIGDEGRGTQIEALISYFASVPNLRLYCLSAVLRNPEEISEWLEIQPLIGNKRDRPTDLTILTRPVSGRDDEILRLLPKVLDEGNVLIFCSRKRKGGAESCAKRLGELVFLKMDADERKRAVEFSQQIKRDYPYLVDLPKRIAEGVAFHHADLEVSLRKDIVSAFQEKIIKVIAATPTLAAGINVPARTVILRDITRFQDGRLRLIPVSEAINMLGRAGRPQYDKKGTGYILVPRNRINDSETQRFIQNVEKQLPETLVSQIPQTGSNILFFILSTVIRTNGALRDEIIDAYNNTLWAFHGEKLSPPMVSGDDLLSYIGQRLERRKDVAIDLDSVQCNHECVIAEGGSQNYQISISEAEVTCECPAFRFSGRRSCKHIHELQYQTIRGEIKKKHPTAKAIGLASLKKTGIIENPMFQLVSGVEILLEQGFLEEDENKLLYITEDGRRALISHWLSLGHIRILRDRIASSKAPKNEEEIIRWAMEDFAPEELSEFDGTESSDFDSFPDDIQKQFEEYLCGKPYREVFNNTQIQKFLRAREKMEQIIATYQALCPSDRKILARYIRDAQRRVHYGCTKELLPIMILELEEITDASSAQNLMSHGLSDIHKISSTSSSDLQTILSLEQHQANHLLEVATQISRLISEYKGEYPDPLKDREAFATLSVRTGVQREDLLDYLL